MASITSANSIFLLGISTVFPVPQLLQGYATDDAFSTESVEPAETKMGVDGKLSAGFVFMPIKLSITLQADSASILLFDAWYAAQKAQLDVYFANGLIRLKSVSKSYVLTNGVLSGYMPIPDAKKTLDPLKYAITWESVVGAPI
jgi:hypothetical protein